MTTRRRQFLVGSTAGLVAGSGVARAQTQSAPVRSFLQQHSVPGSGELVIMSNTSSLTSPALPKYPGAVKKGLVYLSANHGAVWNDFIKENLRLRNKISKASWDALPRISRRIHFSTIQRDILPNAPSCSKPS